ncbi:MAG: malectin domain-containing carbohydrate-binding protein, partial [Bacteroidota bacterium]
VYAQVTLVADSLFTSTAACLDQGTGNAEVSVTPTGGATPYSYLWDANAGSSTNDTVFGLSNGTYYVTVTDANGCTAIDSALVDGNTGTCDTCALPTGWTNQDIGTPTPGDVCYNTPNQEFCVTANGNDIWGNADNFHYVWQNFGGDGEIIARVTQLENTDPWAKAGVMIRESLNADSKHAFMCKAFAQGVSFQRRGSTGGGSQHTTTANSNLPVWVRLVRSGNTFTGYWSLDGVTWTQQGTQNVVLTSNTYIGLAVTSHANGTLNTAKFDNVQIISTSSVQASASVITDYNGADVTCNGATDANVTVTATGGAAPYTYQWDAAAGSSTNDTVFGLGAGTYSVTVTDAAAGTSVASVTVTEPTPVVGTAAVIAQESSAGAADGSAYATASGGISPYTYLWSANAGSSTNDSIFGLTADTYYVTVTDANGCAALDSVEIIVDTVVFAIRINAGGPNYTAVNGDLFIADVHFNNGNTYQNVTAIANTNDPTLYHTERFLANLGYSIPVPQAGNYEIRLHFAEIYPPNNSVGVRIFDASLEGQLVLDDYDIVADVGQFTAAVKVFTVNVTDGVLNLDFTTSVNNAKISAIEVIESSGATLNLTASATDVSCFGGNDGAIDITVTGGSPSYTYNW